MSMLTILTVLVNGPLLGLCRRSLAYSPTLRQSWTVRRRARAGTIQVEFNNQDAFLPLRINKPYPCKANINPAINHLATHHLCRGRIEGAVVHAQRNIYLTNRDDTPITIIDGKEALTIDALVYIYLWHTSCVGFREYGEDIPKSAPRYLNLTILTMYA